VAHVDGWTWVHWKVLDLAFDQTPVPELINEHYYVGFSGWSGVLPASTPEETRTAIFDLLAAGAITVIGAGDEDLTRNDVEALLSDPGTWGPDPSNPARAYAVVDQPLAEGLLVHRPGEVKPRRPGAG
jgi:hypothetical protein